MKIIQSYWSKPAQSSDMVEGRANGGWLAPEYHYMSMALSCLLLRRHYADVELITDTAGKELLIDRLDLPFTKVCVALDALDAYPPSMWAVAKLYAYSLQQEPFLHVDGDVFTWQPLTAARPELIVQSPELEHDGIYRAALLDLITRYDFLPECLRHSINRYSTLPSINAGVLGGCDIPFLQRYAHEALTFIQRNLAALARDEKAATYNVVIEQLLFWHLAKQDQKYVDFVVPKLSLDFTEVTRFEQVPFATTYVHLISAAKKQFYLCDQVEARLRYEFPHHYKQLHGRLMELLPMRALVPVGAHQEDILPLSSEMPLTQTYFPERSIIELATLTFTQLQSWAGMDMAQLSWVSQVHKFEVVAYECMKLPAFSSDVRHTFYRFVSNCTANQILSLTVTLASSARIVETLYPLEVLNGSEVKRESASMDDPYYIIIQNRCTGLYAQYLEGWSKLLVYFEGDELSGNDLLRDLFGSDSNIGFNHDSRTHVIDMLCAHLVYTGYLQVAKSCVVRWSS